MKASGSWRPIIDLSCLNRFVRFSKFHMGTPQLVLRPVRLGDWMVSLVLKDAYLQIPVHPESQRYLRFGSFGHSSFQGFSFWFDLGPTSIYEGFWHRCQLSFVF